MHIFDTKFYIIVDQLNKILDVLGLYHRLSSEAHSQELNVSPLGTPDETVIQRIGSEKVY